MDEARDIVENVDRAEFGGERGDRRRVGDVERAPLAGGEPGR